MGHPICVLVLEYQGQRSPLCSAGWIRALRYCSPPVKPCSSRRPADPRPPPNPLPPHARVSVTAPHEKGGVLRAAAAADPNAAAGRQPQDELPHLPPIHSPTASVPRDGWLRRLDTGGIFCIR